MRLALYALLSLVAATAVVANAMIKRDQFYNAAIYISNSKLSLLVFGNAVFTMVLIAGKMSKAVFFGTLREIEVEQMYDKAWSALIEMLIAMTIFREEFNNKFVALALSLIHISEPTRPY
eukprot:TRINITY_DN11954_c0_g1_i1.p1 TRINITY_DN11954_c0_g1~~TRINITY_DN11954_c0_g1_i1.p1  ORF type:complete len:120 (+),score=49.23 TRINITY_DN11954_c0_g1_i1:228-587(+)